MECVVAMNEDRIIGDGNKLLWHLPGDLKRLKSMTMGAPLIMGRKTWESIGRPLPGRANIVLTRSNLTNFNGAIVVNSFDEAIQEADIYGPSLPKLTGINIKPKSNGKKIIPHNAFGLQVMSIGYLVPEDAATIWRGPMVMSAIEQLLRDVDWQNLDILIIDMPPGTGDAQLTLSQRVQLAGAIIVSTPQDLSLIDARKGLNMFKKVNVPILGIIENMSYFLCEKCETQHNIFGNGGAKAEADKLGVPFLDEIPLDISLRTSSDEGKPIVFQEPDNLISKKYLEIANLIAESLEKQKKPMPTIIQ